MHSSGSVSALHRRLSTLCRGMQTKSIGIWNHKEMEDFRGQKVRGLFKVTGVSNSVSRDEQCKVIHLL